MGPCRSIEVYQAAPLCIRCRLELHQESSRRSQLTPAANEEMRFGCSGTFFQPPLCLFGRGRHHLSKSVLYKSPDFGRQSTWQRVSGAAAASCQIWLTPLHMCLCSSRGLPSKSLTYPQMAQSAVSRSLARLMAALQQRLCIKVCSCFSFRR